MEMDRNSAMKKFSNYMQSYNIPFLKDYDSGIARFTMDYRGFKNVLGGSIESCIWWFKEAAEVRVYFNELYSELCKNHPERHKDLYRLFNFINARIWIQGSDFCDGRLYTSTNLYDPRIYMTEDGDCDITMTFSLPYDFYELAPLESEDFITATLPDLLSRLSPAILSIISGKFSTEEAISYLQDQGLAG